MSRVLAAILTWLALALPAIAQQATTCPDAPLGDTSFRCANTRFVQQNAGGGGGIPPLATNRIFIGNGSNLATAAPMTGDCTVTFSAGNAAIVCTKTNGVNFGPFATGTAASNLTGTVPANRGGAGSTVGILQADGAGNVSAVTIGSMLQFSAGTLNINPSFNSITIGSTIIMLGTTVGTVTGLSAPSVSTDAATKGYVDNAVAGLTCVLANARFATTAALAANTYNNGASGVGATLTGNANGSIGAIDGTIPSVADRLLINNEATAANRGIYVVTTVGDGSNPYVITRAADFDTAAEMLAGCHTLVTAGTVSAGSTYSLQATVATVGTSPATFVLTSFPSSSQWVNGAVGAITYAGGKVGVGSSAAPDASLTVSGNTVALPAGLTGTLLHVGGANSTNAYLTIDAFNGVPQVNLRASLGTAASPSALTSGSALGFICWSGYGTSAYSDNCRTVITSVAAEGWTNTAQGTHLGFWTAAVGGTTIAEKMRLTEAGRLGIGTSSPAAQLHTTGTMRLAGLPGVGTAGCLVNDTSGNITAGSPCTTQYAFNVKAPPYNATGNAGTDDAAAIQAAVDAAGSAGRGAIYFPCGQYKINAQIVSTLDRLDFYGDGGGCSQIRVNNAAGGIAVTMASLNFGSKISFRDLDIICASGGACGTAISVVSTAVVTGDGNLNNLDIHNVRITSSSDSAATEKYTNGVYLKNISNTDIYNLEITQLQSNSGKGIYLDFANNTGLTPGYGIRMYNLHVEAMEYGFYSTGGLEGIQFFNPGLFGVNTGIRIDGSGGFGGRAGDLTIVGGAINAKNKTIHVNQWKSIRISNMDLYKGVGSGTDVCDHVLYFENTQWTLLSNNHIATAISLTACGGAMVTGNAVDKFVVTGNTLQGVGSVSARGVQVFGGAVLTTLTGNVIDNLGGQLAISVNSNYVTCFGNSGGGTGGISTAGSGGGINCGGGSNNF